MTRDQIEDEAREVANAARRQIRDEFQAKHPKYVPPPWAGVPVWERWLEANIDLHGEIGFVERRLAALVPSAIGVNLPKMWGL